MPIRFRCVYCDKLLGIATRKAGTVVNCPQCGQPLIVPTPDPEPEPKPATTSAKSAPTASATAPGKIFDEDDFDVLLEQEPTVRAAPEPAQRGNYPKAKPQPPATAPLPSKQHTVENRLPVPAASQAYAPLPLPAPRGLLLSGAKLIIAIAVVCFLILGAFAAGIVVGRMI